jgi:hypothetical protein
MSRHPWAQISVQGWDVVVASPVLAAELRVPVSEVSAVGGGLPRTDHWPFEPRVVALGGDDDPAHTLGIVFGTPQTLQSHEGTAETDIVCVPIQDLAVTAAQLAAAGVLVEPRLLERPDGGAGDPGPADAPLDPYLAAATLHAPVAPEPPFETTSFAAPTGVADLANRPSFDHPLTPPAEPPAYGQPAPRPADFAHPGVLPPQPAPPAFGFASPGQPASAVGAPPLGGQPGGSSPFGSAPFGPAPASGAPGAFPEPGLSTGGGYGEGSTPSRSRRTPILVAAAATVAVVVLAGTVWAVAGGKGHATVKAAANTPAAGADPASSAPSSAPPAAPDATTTTTAPAEKLRTLAKDDIADLVTLVTNDAHIGVRSRVIDPKVYSNDALTEIQVDRQGFVAGYEIDDPNLYIDVLVEQYDNATNARLDSTTLTKQAATNLGPTEPFDPNMPDAAAFLSLSTGYIYESFVVDNIHVTMMMGQFAGDSTETVTKMAADVAAALPPGA